MLILSVIWLVEGLMVGALATGARLRPDLWKRYGTLRMLGLGALAGLVGGWLGALLYGRYFGFPTALWVSVLVVVAARVGPPIVAWARERLAARTTVKQ